MLIGTLIKHKSLGKIRLKIFEKSLAVIVRFILIIAYNLVLKRNEGKLIRGRDIVHVAIYLFHIIIPK